MIPGRRRKSKPRPRARRASGRPPARNASENICRAMWSLLAPVIVTLTVSLSTQPRPASELEGPVYGRARSPSQGRLPVPWRPVLRAAALFVAFNIVFW